MRPDRRAAYSRSMIATTFDTCAAAKTLREAGFDERHHEEAMAAHADQHRALEALIAGPERQAESLETVIERTAPRPGAAA